MTNNTSSERIETTVTKCDGCGREATCAMLGPDGCYTLALCAACHKPLRDQMVADGDLDPGTSPFDVSYESRWDGRKYLGRVWAVDYDTAYFMAFEIFEDLPVQVVEVK